MWLVFGFLWRGKEHLRFLVVGGHGMDVAPRRLEVIPSGPRWVGSLCEANSLSRLYQCSVLYPLAETSKIRYYKRTVKMASN